MSVVQLLMDTAVEDSQLLVKNQEIGDRAEIPRDIEFVLYAKDEEKARLVASFVADYRYGRPSVERVEHRGVDSWQLLITIHSPTTENVVMALSAFMVCLSKLYDLDYDGWSCTIQK
ncbi:MAG: ribonuclease E inhibitor RraB [Pirellulaceae bacterium]